MKKTLALIKASKERIQAELALSAIDWTALPLLFKQLGNQLTPEYEKVIVNTTCNIKSILATRNVLVRIGDRNRFPRIIGRQNSNHRKVVHELCSEIVGWTGAWLSLTDTVDICM
jgi:hypothetical protein